jgi:hypothetical protein
LTAVEILIVVVIAAIVLALGFGVGMLVARPLGRWLARDDEEPHDD